MGGCFFLLRDIELCKQCVRSYHNSREENEKYREMKVNDTTSRIGVYYTNGFLISYPNNGSSYKQVMAVDTDSNWHNEKLFK